MAKKYISVEGTDSDPPHTRKVVEHKSKKEAHAYGKAMRAKGATIFVHDAEFAKQHGLDPRTRTGGSPVARNSKIMKHVGALKKERQGISSTLEALGRKRDGLHTAKQATSSREKAQARAKLEGHKDAAFYHQTMVQKTRLGVTKTKGVRDAGKRAAVVPVARDQGLFGKRQFGSVKKPSADPFKARLGLTPTSARLTGRPASPTLRTSSSACWPSTSRQVVGRSPSSTSTG